MAIKTLNTLLSLIPKGDDKGRGDKGDNKPKGDDKANDKGKGEDNGESGENGESGDSSDSDKGSDSNGHGNDDVGSDEKGTTMEDFKDIAGDIVNEIMNGGDGGLKDKDDVVQEVATEEKQLVRGIASVVLFGKEEKSLHSSPSLPYFPPRLRRSSTSLPPILALRPHGAPPPPVYKWSAAHVPLLGSYQSQRAKTLGPQHTPCCAR